MFFQQLPTTASSLSYFFGCGGLGYAIAVDVVVGDEAWFVEQARLAGLSGKPSSTLAFEKRFNPALSLPREAFVESLLAQIPPRPAEMDRIVAKNIAA